MDIDFFSAGAVVAHNLAWLLFRSLMNINIYSGLVFLSFPVCKSTAKRLLASLVVYVPKNSVILLIFLWKLTLTGNGGGGLNYFKLIL